MSGGLTPMRGSVTTNARLNLRKSRPDVTAPIFDKVDPGRTLDVVGLIDGTVVSGNATWYAGPNDVFFWSGGCGDFRPESTDGQSPMRVNRRPNGSIKALEDRDIKSIYGNPSFTEGTPRGAVRLDPAWTAQNIVTMPSPILAAADFPQIRVHRLARPHFDRVFAAIAAAGLDDVIITCAGTFVPRHKAWNPNRGLSSHTWGLAIDLNVHWNGYGAIPAAVGTRGSVRELVPLFEASGFAWGGYFEPQSICDGMHFELARLDP